MKIPIFYSYSHKDEIFRNELNIHLELLRKNNLIEGWSDREIAPGSNWEEEINLNIQRAKIILLLISPDFIASDYCYETETIFALEQHNNNNAKVIPIIIRPCLWKYTQFKHLQVLPKEGKAVTTWENRDLAWLNVVEGILKLVEEIRVKEKENDLKVGTISDTVQVKGQYAAGRDIIIEKSKSYVQHNEYKKKRRKDKQKDQEQGILQEKNISALVLQFLREYRQWYFSPLRILKWGGKRTGYENLSKSNSEEIRQILDVLKKDGVVKTTESKNGNTIYKIKRH